MYLIFSFYYCVKPEDKLLEHTKHLEELLLDYKSKLPLQIREGCQSVVKKMVQQPNPASLPPQFIESFLNYVPPLNYKSPSVSRAERIDT